MSSICTSNELHFKERLKLDKKEKETLIFVLKNKKTN